MYLGSAQLDKQAEESAMSLEGEGLIFVTPEWIAKPEKISALQRLSEAGKLSLIAIDEAHLVSDWSDFRKAYLELGNLLSRCPNDGSYCHCYT